MCATQYFSFSTLRLSALYGKNQLQKAFVPLDIRRVAELLFATVSKPLCLSYVPFSLYIGSPRKWN